jgi:hypothetical protein
VTTAVCIEASPLFSVRSLQSGPSRSVPRERLPGTTVYATLTGAETSVVCLVTILSRHQYALVLTAALFVLALLWLVYAHSVRAAGDLLARICQYRPSC